MSSPTVVLVHGAFADASGFAGVIRELTGHGHAVLAPPNPLRGPATDAATVGAAVAAVEGPVLLVGHSYGGAVITQAAAALPNVVGLVYLAAFAPAAGESVAGVQEPFAAPPLAGAIRPTPYDAVGAVGGPDLLVDPVRFPEVFCADVPADLARVMAVSQRPLAAAATAEPLTAEGYATVATWFQIPLDDRAINPEAQRFMAKRMSATVEEVDGSHASFIAQPVRAAGFIRQALAAL